MYVPLDSAAQFVETATHALRPGKPGLLLVAEGSLDGLPELLAEAKAAGLLIVGAVFPGITVGKLQYRTGALLMPLDLAPGVRPVVAQLEHESPQWNEAPPFLAKRNRRPTALVLADCLASGLSAFLRDLFDRYGNTVGYFGAGAGTSKLEPRPVMIWEGALVSNIALLLLVDQPSQISVRHGFTRARGPFVATRTRNNVILELNWQPALDVYQAELGDEIPRPLTPETFFQAIGPYPFGIDKEGAEDIVRDPIMITPERGLQCLSDVPENSVMHVLRGTVPTLVAAANTAVEAGLKALPGPAIFCLICDCFSRTLVLGDRFSEELEVTSATLAAHQPPLQPEGILALGEIASDGERMPELFNKTFVIALFHG